MTETARDAGPRRRTRVVVTAVALALACALLLVAVVIVASVVGSPRPSPDALPDLPDGYTLARPESGCGSGGCFLVATVTGPAPLAPDEIVEVLREAVTGCRANGLFDRRELCASVEVSGDGSVELSVMLRDLGK